jgi:hypothetical protein
MSKTLCGVATVTLGLLVLGMPQASSNTSGAEASPVPSVYRLQKKKPQDSKDFHHDGHDHLPKGKMEKLPDGKHHFHTTKTGHKLHVLLKNGKVNGMEVTDKDGQPVTVERLQKSKKTSARGDGEAHDLFPVAQGPVGGFVCFRYRCFQPVYQVIVFVYIWWPADSCCCCCGEL